MITGSAAATDGILAAEAMSGTDAAMDCAGIMLMGGDIAAVPLALRLSRDTMRTIRGNADAQNPDFGEFTFTNCSSG